MSLIDTSLPSLPYPANTKIAATEILQIPTTAQLTSFSDKLLLTISQHGKLAQWFSVPLAADNPSASEGFMAIDGVINGDGEGEAEGEVDQIVGLLVPQSRFQARTLVGGGGGEREVWGGLVARCVAGLVVGKGRQGRYGDSEGESRVLIVGLGLVGIRFDTVEEEERRELFLRILELVSRVL